MSNQPAATLVASREGEPVRDKTVSAAEAIWLIHDERRPGSPMAADPRDMTEVTYRAA